MRFQKFIVMFKRVKTTIFQVRNFMAPFLLSFIFLFYSVAVCCQEPPQVSIVQPINGTVFDGVQVKVDYIVTGTTVNSVRIQLDDRPVQLLTDVRIGQNTAMVDVPPRDCKISVVVRNEFGESAPAVVHLKRSDHIFKPKLYVLSVGVSKYFNPDLQLHFAAKDAVDFSQAMLRQEGLLYEKVELRLLTDEYASAENIRDGLNWLQTQTTQHDVAMLYMAGHGINNNIGDFYFMPVNADVERLNATCVSYREIKRTIDANAGKLLVFMDACHSGNMMGNTQRAAMLSMAIAELTGADNGAVVFTSSTGRQFSLENPTWGNGAFTKALVEGLNGAADLFGRQTITVKNLDSYITNRVKDLTNGQQSPTTIIPSSVPDFPLAVVDVNITIKVENLNIYRPSTTVSASSVTGLLTAHNRKVYQRSKLLSKTEVREMMTLNPDALGLYNKSMSRNRTGNMMYALAVVTPVAGSLLGLNTYNKDPYYINDNGNDAGMILALKITTYTGVSIGMVTTGLILKSSSKRIIRSSVDFYNNGVNTTTSNTELKFGITGNGFGMALIF